MNENMWRYLLVVFVFVMCLGHNQIFRATSNLAHKQTRLISSVNQKKIHNNAYNMHYYKQIILDTKQNDTLLKK